MQYMPYHTIPLLTGLICSAVDAGVSIDAVVAECSSDDGMDCGVSVEAEVAVSENNCIVDGSTVAITGEVAAGGGSALA